MKYIKQFGIIIGISFVGEILNYYIPLPIPASIYGLVILFACLCSGILKVESVKHTAYFLIEIMALMFIPAAVGLMDSWSVLQSNLAAYLVITVVSTLAVMLAAGWVTQLVLRIGKRKKGGHHGAI